MSDTSVVMGSDRGVLDISSEFRDPSLPSRPLAIMHAFDRLLKETTKSPSETGWVSSPDPEGLSNDNLLEALERIKRWGFGGVVTNVSWHNYLRDEEKWKIFLQGIEICRKLGLRIWIYDEEGYPSGTAGGLVLKDHPEFEAQVLVSETFEVPTGKVHIPPPFAWLGNVYALSRCAEEITDISEHVDSEGNLVWHAKCNCAIERFDVQTAFEGTHLTTRQIHAVRRYINVLDPLAVEAFCDLTHRNYADRMGADFSSVEAFFTDEPLMTTAYFQEVPDTWKRWLSVEDTPNSVFKRLPRLPWRADLPDVFRKRWGYDLLPRISSLFWGDGQEDRVVRHDFHELVSELYAESFFGTIQRFLGRQGVALSGHILFEEPIVQHVATAGSMLANLRRMWKPGIDMYTCDTNDIVGSPRLLTCKYGSSAAHISGRNDIMSEVSDWVQWTEGNPAPLEQRRCALAIQAALGITTFTSYFKWQGYAEADVRGFMDFCGRLHSVVRYGVHVAPVALLYPIRAAWTHYLPVADVLTDETQIEPLASLDASLLSIAHNLLQKQVDFDFVDSQALREAVAEADAFRISQERYQVLLIPPSAVLSEEDLSNISRLAGTGTSIVQVEPDAFWIDLVLQRVDRDLLLYGNTESVLVRQSRFEDGDIFLIVNTSNSPIRLRSELSSSSERQLWDLMDGSIRPFSRDLEIDSYGAVVLSTTSPTMAED